MSVEALKTIKFIRDLYNKPQDFIPLHVPTLKGNEKKYLNECVDSTFVSSVGEFVDKFEKELVNYTKAKYAIVCVNGTNAIHIALELVGVKDNDEVITQPLTFIATANAIYYANAIPVFVDVDKDTMGMSPEALKLFLEDNTIQKNNECFNKFTNRRIKACLPMHTFGHACRIEEIAAICLQFNIELVEDAAEAMGSFYKGKHLGTYGKVSAISFNGNKIMTTGGGGVILTDNPDIAKRAKHLTTQCKIPHQWEYDHDAIGYNYRMPNVNAALGLAQLEQLTSFVANKRETAKEYIAFFDGFNDVIFFEERKGEEQCNYWLHAIILKDKVSRDVFLKETNAKGVMTRPIWKLMNKLSMFEDCPKGELKNAEWLEDRVVNITSSVR